MLLFFQKCENRSSIFAIDIDLVEYRKFNTISGITEKYICQKRPPHNRITTYLFSYENDNPSAEFLRYKVFNESFSGTISETYYTKNLKFAKQFFAEKPLLMIVSLKQKKELISFPLISTSVHLKPSLRMKSAENVSLNHLLMKSERIIL